MRRAQRLVTNTLAYVSTVNQLMAQGFTRVQADERLLYLGEDVEHGGYYRVTEGLARRFGRRRSFDWPPDEASRMG